MARLETGFKVAGPKLTVDRLRLQLHENPMLVATRPLEVRFGKEKILIAGDPIPGLNLSLDYDKATNVWALQKIRLQEEGHILNASGLYRPDKTLQLKVKGDLNAKHVANVRTYLNDAKGVLGVDLQVNGSTSRPQVTGNIRLKRVLLDVRGLGDPLAEMSGDIRLSPTQIRLDEIKAAHGDGEFRANGTIGIDGIDPKSFNLDERGHAIPPRVRSH
jgi:autotransporter translocation and assembly factor TamB